MHSKGHSDEVSDKNDKYVTENQREGNPYYKVGKNFTESCPHPTVLWKTKLANNEISYLAEETSKQSVERLAQFLVTVYSKMHVEK